MLFKYHAIKVGGRGGHILLRGGRVSREGLNVLMRYLNSPLNKKLRHIHQRAKENFLQDRANSHRKLHKASNRSIKANMCEFVYGTNVEIFS